MQPRLLQASIASSHVPGSAAWYEALSSPDAKERLVLKVARGEGGGKGNVFGHNVAREEWHKCLRAVGDGRLVEGKGLILQCKIN